MKFMVCYDGSETAKTALKLALNHAKIWNATLNVVKTVTRADPIKHSKVKKMERELEEELKDLLGEHDTPYNILLLLTEQKAGEILVTFAKDEKIDQMFIGILKKSKVGKMIYGSSAQYIILNAPCPVVSINKS